MVDTHPVPPSARPAARASRLGRFAIAALRRLLSRWVAVRVVGAEALQAGLDRGRPVCWALQFRQLSALVVLDEQARRLGLPLPLAPLASAGAQDSHGVESHAFVFLTRDGPPSPLASRPQAYAPRLQRLVAAVRADPAADVVVVPVQVFWGRAPGSQGSILAALFAEGWAIPGVLRQAVRILIHGRQTLLEFGEPASLRDMIDGAADDAQAVRRAARRLRAAFRRGRERAIGPDLSHRRTLIGAVVAGEPVQRAIDDAARTRGIDRDRAEGLARRAAWEIASHYSYPFIRAYDLALQRLWNRLYDGIDAHRFDALRAIPGGTTIVYVPCHRSHVDYLLLSYLVNAHGLPPPHVAAGANLDLPVVGGLLRRGGAFFLRRSFRGDVLYAAVFAEYLHAMLARGVSIEYFVEGGRSRTGRTLSPRAGLLAMTVESWLRGPHRPLVFVPVYVGYERLLEGEAYVAELSGRPKRKESLAGLLRALRRLRGHFGRVHVNVGEPIALGAFLHGHGVGPGAPNAGAGEAGRGAEVAESAASDDADAARRAAIGALAREIAVRINDAAVVGPVNLVATAMLGTPRQAMDAAQLERQIDVMRALLAAVPHARRTEVTALPAAAIVAEAERTGLLRRIPHPLGDLLHVAPAHAALLPYFGNNVLHVFALPSLLAALLERHPGLPRERLLAIVRRVFPVLRDEFFLPWDEAELETRVGALLAAFAALGLARPIAGADDAADEGHDAASLHGLAQPMREPLERYAVVLSVLTERPAGAFSATALEDLCVLLAQRLAWLHRGGAPDTVDPASFRSIVASLGELGWVSTVGGRLVFDDALRETAADAGALLPPRIRIAIAQLARQTGGPGGADPRPRAFRG
jgi:glycerol-3-phosphate O-acyltransferase